jgi:hypothetical protein
MNRPIYVETDRQTVEKTYDQTDRRKEGSMNRQHKRTNGNIDRPIGRLTNRLSDEQTDRETDRKTKKKKKTFLKYNWFKPASV